MFMNGTELVGLIGVYVDDFWWLGVTTIPSSRLLCQHFKGPFNGGAWNDDNFTLTGIEI